MKSYLSPQQGINELVGILEKRLDLLATRMRAKPQRLRVDTAYHIPFRDQAMVDESKGVVVTPLGNAEAAQQVIYGLTSIRVEAGKQNPRETLRVPGVVALPSDWLNELQELNTVKQEIEELVGKIKKPERVKMWGSMKYLSSLQAMRQPLIVSGPAKIRFYWDAAPSVRHKTAAMWIEHYSKELKDLHGHIPMIEELSAADGSRKLVFGINVLSEQADPAEYIAEFRQGQPHIRARVTFIDKIDAIIRPTSMPICYSIDDPVPLITPLTSWDSTQRSTRQSDRVKISAVPFIEALYLHRYKEPH